MTTTPAPPSDPLVELRRTLLPEGVVRELSRRRPGRAVRDTAVCWALIVGAYAVAAQVETPWAYVLAAAVVGNRYYALYIIGHDGLHRRLFPGTARNDLFADLFTLGPIGGITRLNNRNHLGHHQLLATPADPDRHRHGCFNKANPLALLGYLTAATSLVRSVRNVFGGGGRAVDAGRPGYRLRDVAIIVGWQVGLLVVLTTVFGWWAYPLLWWAPVFVFAILGDNFRSFVEHSHVESDAVADTHRLVTTDASWIERQLVAPMNMNLHAAHHLWPSIPYYNLPAADAAMRATPAGAALTRRRSYLGYLWTYARALPIEGCEPAAAVG